MWCLERNIHITAQCLPGIQNTIAHAESRTIVGWFDWKLNLNLYRRIDHLFGPIEVDLFASILTAQYPIYFSWRPDPYAAAMDAFLQDWSQGMISFANPPWGLIGHVLSQAQSQKGPPSPSGTSVEVSAMVPHPSGNAGGLPTSTTKGLSGDDQPRSINPNTATGRIAYLWDRYRNNQLSEEAVELMLNSWRTKTNKSYDSLFRKWHCWYDEQGFVPISGPITSVFNFLASLHKKGFQYNLVNAYRSAISLVYEKDDVGKHPLVVWMLKGIYHDRPRYLVTPVHRIYKRC